MKNFFLTFTILFSFFTVSQELKKPSEGKSIVYFTRKGFYGGAINFKYFDGDKYLGKFNSGNYLVYECEPGKHIFWAHSENFDFVEANLEAGKVYIIQSIATTGAFKANVDLVPLDKSSQDFEKQKNKLKKFVTDIENRYFLDPNEKQNIEVLNELVTKSKTKFEEHKKESGKVLQLTPEMNIE